MDKIQIVRAFAQASGIDADDEQFIRLMARLSAPEIDAMLVAIRHAIRREIAAFARDD